MNKHPPSILVTMRGLIVLMRPHHWIKNVFVLVPAFFGGRIYELGMMTQVLGATLAFCLAASLIYIFNDLRDIEADRLHTKKNSRPLASGAVSPAAAIGLFSTLLIIVAALLIWLKLPTSFLLIAGSYVILNIGYSVGLKQLALAEIFLVSSGYILRLIAGSLVVQEHLTSWIIACTGLVSLLLTVGKRRADLIQNNDSQKKRRSLESYTIAYLDHLMTMLAAATIVTYLLFTMSEYAQTRFGEYVMISAIFVIFGIMRYLQIVYVESGGDQPTSLLYRDKWMIGTLFAYMLYFAITIYLV